MDRNQGELLCGVLSHKRESVIVIIIMIIIIIKVFINNSLRKQTCNDLHSNKMNKGKQKNT